jgi:hypothetical protein
MPVARTIRSADKNLRCRANLVLIGLPILIFGCNVYDAWLRGCADTECPLHQSVNHGKAPRLHPRGRVNGPGRTIYIAGQLGYDAAGKQGVGFRAQATLVYEI